jgi:hypothetical protein
MRRLGPFGQSAREGEQHVDDRLRIDIGGQRPATTGVVDDLGDQTANRLHTSPIRVITLRAHGPLEGGEVRILTHQTVRLVQQGVESVDHIGGSLGGGGDPADPATVCGPVISARQRDRVMDYLDLALSEGGSFA